MFCENLKTLRKAKGLSQEDLAARLHVVRQTVSKWEKGLSVPDADLLIRLAEELETTVGKLLGDSVEPEADKNKIAEQLEQLNAWMAEKNRRSRKLWKAVKIVLIVAAALLLLQLLLSAAAYTVYRVEPEATVRVQAVDSEPANSK